MLDRRQGGPARRSGRRHKADALASQVRRPAGATANHPVDQLVPARRSRSPAASSASTGSRRARELGHRADRPRRLARPQDQRQAQDLPALVYQPMTPGFAGARGPADHARPDAPRRGRRRARRALPQRRRASCARRSRCTRTASVHARLRRRLPRRAHAHRRLRRARRGVHLHLGVRRRTRSASGPTTTTGPTTRSTRSAGCSARSIIREQGRQGARRRARAVPAPAARRRSPAWSARSSASTGARSPATRRRCGPGSARTSPSTCSGWTTTSTTSTSTATAGRTPPARSSTPPAVGPERDHHRPVHRGQPGPLALPLPRLLPSGRGHGGLVPGEPVNQKETQ